MPYNHILNTKKNKCISHTVIKEKKTTLSSASSGRWRRISSGSVSAAITTISEIPLFNVFVAETPQLESKTRISKKENKYDPTTKTTLKIKTKFSNLLFCSNQMKLKKTQFQKLHKKAFKKKKKKEETFISTLFELFVVGSLLNNVHY